MEFNKIFKIRIAIAILFLVYNTNVNFQFHEYILNKKENIRRKEWYIYEKKYL